LSTGQTFIQWIASQPLSLLLNNQFYPLASCPLDKELSSGQPYPVDNFIQYFEQPGPGVLSQMMFYNYINFHIRKGLSVLFWIMLLIFKNK